MRDSRIPSFSSEELQKAVTNARSLLEGVDEARNRVSNDIKALEAYLQDLNLKDSFRYPLGKCFVSGDRHAAVSVECGGSASGEIEEGTLMWGEHSGGKFRLLYEHSRWEGYIDVDEPGGPYHWEGDTLQREAKPLIERPFEVRKRVYQHLPDFITALARHLDVRPPGRLQPDEVPF